MIRKFAHFVSRRKVLGVFIVTIGVAPVAAVSQVKSNGDWVFPEDIKSLCIDVEQQMVATNRALIERNRERFGITKPDPKLGKLDYEQVTSALKSSLEEQEHRWQRLGCVGIIYRDRK
jgi:hypothetical protein